MLDPLCNSRSNYLNSLSSSLLPGVFLRWGWRAYLELDSDHPENQFNKDMKKSLETCAWKENDNIWRLCCPSLTGILSNDISSSSSSSSSSSKRSPVFIVSTATADPLEDDGICLVKMLKQSGFNVTHHKCIGSHYLSIIFDSKGRG